MNSGRAAVAVPRSVPVRARAGAVADLLPERWSLAYVAFLAYTFGMVTGRLPIGTPAAVLAVVLLALEGRRPAVPPWFRWMIGMLLWGAVGLVTTRYPAQVQLGLIEFLKLVVVVGLGINIIRTRRQAAFFLVFALGVYLLYPVRGTFVRYFVHHDTAFGRAIGVGIYENSNDLAALTLLQLSVALALYMDPRRGWTRQVALGIAAVLALVIVLTQSRGVYLGTAFFGALLIRSQRHKLRIMLALTVASVVILVTAPEGTFDRFSRLTSLFGGGEIAELDAEGSAEGRAEIYRLAVRISLDHPVTGVGLDAYPLAHRDYAMRSGQMTTATSGALDTHSTYLNALAETGVPGLIMYLAMLGTALRSTVRIRRRLRPYRPDLHAELGVLLAGFYGFMLAAVVGTYTSLALPYVHLCAIWLLARTGEREAAALASGRALGPAEEAGGQPRGRRALRGPRR